MGGLSGYKIWNKKQEKLIQWFLIKWDTPWKWGGTSYISGTIFFQKN